MSGDVVEGFEFFAAYKVCIAYPSDWELQINALKRSQGFISFKSKKDERYTCSLTWGPLKDVKKKSESLEGHVESIIGDLKNKRGIKNFKLLEEKKITVNDHEAMLFRAEVDFRSGALFSKTCISTVIQALYLYCEESERYLILYALSPIGDEFFSAFNYMVESLRCH
ncbi:MAG: hypothetical protein QFX33_05345 [Candidatus Nezhaarchaeota archaeon]|nr:hypothetical protein [Candidatus Nezhaarchaeota archaeon]